MTLFAVMVILTLFALTPRQDAERVRIVQALAHAGVSRKAAAITMHLTEQRLSEALNGKSPLSVFRLADLPDAFQEAYDELRVTARGGVVVRDAKLAQLVGGVEKLVCAKAELAAEAKKEIA